jgi:hypothetical protein
VAVSATPRHPLERDSERLLDAQEDRELDLGLPGDLLCFSCVMCFWLIVLH